jgi:hybrid cluster-associated redox disulfide protein
MRKITKITKHTNLAKIIDKHPEVATILADYELYCYGCFANTFETLESGALAHGLDQKTISEIVKKINAKINND